MYVVQYVEFGEFPLFAAVPLVFVFVFGAGVLKTEDDYVFLEWCDS